MDELTKNGIEAEWIFFRDTIYTFSHTNAVL